MSGLLADGVCTALAGLPHIRLQLDMKIFLPHAKVGLDIEKSLTQGDEACNVKDSNEGR